MGAPKSHWRGHEIYFDADIGEWRYSADGLLVKENDKPCGVCGRERTPEGHDPCLGELPGVVNACCGHGNPKEAYVQFKNGVEIRGFDAIYRAEW